MFQYRLPMLPTKHLITSTNSVNVSHRVFSRSEAEKQLISVANNKCNKLSTCELRSGMADQRLTEGSWQA